MKLNLKSIIANLPKLKFPHLPTNLILILVIFSLGILTGYAIFKNYASKPLVQEIPQDKYVAFILESYDKINQNYWENLSEDQLVSLYKQSAERLTGRVQKLNTKGKNTPSPQNPTTQLLPGGNLGASINLRGSSVTDLKILPQNDQQQTTSQRQALEQMTSTVLKEVDSTKKKDFTIQLISQVLQSLQPAGRSGLYTQKMETQLKNTVQNINPEKDLKKEDSPQAQEELKKIAYAKDVLTDQDRKKNYDTKGVEPTTASRLITSDIAYLKFDKFSPTTYEEFVKIVTSYDQPSGPKTLIFDLRGNIGGAIDALPFFLGNFLGDKQYVYDFMRKGELEPYKSVGNKLAGLGRMKQVVILVDNQTQSSAELLAAALKRYHFGIVLGVPTKGWGTVEKVMPLDNQIEESEKYSLFLVHSITLRDDNQPIEGRGVEPDINIQSAGWEKQLLEYFRYPELLAAVKNVI